MPQVTITLETAHEAIQALTLLEQHIIDQMDENERHSPEWTRLRENRNHCTQQLDLLQEAAEKAEPA